MKNKEIAQLLAMKIFGPAKTQTDLAVQLFIEKLSMPDDVVGYTVEEAEQYILQALELKKL